MRYLLAIDPGVRAQGACLFGNERLIDARCTIGKGYGSLPNLVNFHVNATAGFWTLRPDVCVELMRDRKAVPANDLIDVQACGMAVAGACRSKIHLYPATGWKASVPKTVHHKRIRTVLDLDELEVLDRALAVTPEDNRKEILDALGIGLFHLKRTNKAGVKRS